MFLFFCFGKIFSQNNDAVQKEAVKIPIMFSKFHFSEKPADDSLSVFLFDKIIKLLQEDQIFFLKSEIDTLFKYRFLLDDELLGQSWSFYPKLQMMYKLSLERQKSIMSQLLDEPLSFKQDEIYIPLRFRKVIGFNSEAEIKERCRLLLKYRVLLEIFSRLEEDEETDLQKQLQKEADIRKEIIDEDIQEWSFMINDSDNEVLRILFLNALCSYYDPHSTYFTKSGKKSFENELSSEDFRFGISFVTNESNQVVIDELEPGGAAWKCNKLNKGDRVIKLQWEGETEVDVSEMTLEEIHEFLFRDDKMILTFTVKKLNGSRKSVKLKKEKVEKTEELVKSHILSGEHRIGYISLPDFYSGWKGNSSNGCANDVAKEILKLQKDTITGIILDLRNNGGGSLMEALSLAGIFINEGPLAVIHVKGEKPTTLKDENRGVIFNGPLVVLVNGQSASASELLAAVLQDYNRALIVGQSTYGKATGQVVMALDTSLNWQQIARGDFGNAESFVKITTSKLYRINGKTAQKKGVIPDIILPDYYEGLYKREKDYPMSLISDSVLKKTYYMPLQSFPEDILNSESVKRQANDSLIHIQISNRDSAVVLLKDLENGILLNPEKFIDRVQLLEKIYTALSESAVIKNNAFTVLDNSFEKQVLTLDLFYNEMNEEIKKEISGDIQLLESFKIMVDLINFTKN